MDVIDSLSLTRSPTARCPLLGQTVLLIEDSRFASEAVRLMCLRSGARIRRADSLMAAQRHLAVYMPSVLIVDIGLPDGSGIDLIRTTADASARIDVILGTSGDAAQQSAVMDAGANDFVEKPVESLLSFQSQILAHLPQDQQPPSPRAVGDEKVHPDLIAYQDDLAHVALVLEGDAQGHTLDYITQFLSGVAQSARDHDMGRAVTQVVSSRKAGDNPGNAVALLSQMVQSRLAAAGPI